MRCPAPIVFRKKRCHMSREALFEAFIDSIGQPFMFVDNDHMIRYVNGPGLEYYRPGEELTGRSIFDFHNENSCRIIREVHAALQAGEEERMITDNQKHRAWMRAVRALDGSLLGYFERYERPADGN